MKDSDKLLERKIKWCAGLLIIGLFLSALTAIPLLTEVNGLANHFGVAGKSSDDLSWLFRVRDALVQTWAQFPFLFYSTDWLAFGHFAIALVFVGALRDPVRNRWLFDFGSMACLLVIPYALVFGEVRGIPLWWRLIDCSFGIFGFIPLWFCRRWALELERNKTPAFSDCS